MNPKVIVAGLVLMISLASVVSFGVTESWFSDSEQSEIEITLAPLKIEYYSDDGFSWRIWDQSSSSLVVSTNLRIQSNYAVSLYIENGYLSLSGITPLGNLKAGVQYILTETGSVWTCEEVSQ